MANQYKNKVIYNGNTLIDISDTTAIASDVNSGKEIYLASGQKVTGTQQVYTVTNNLTNAISNNSSQKTLGGGLYFAKLTPAEGYLIDSIQITMDGVDITDKVFIGESGSSGGITPTGTINIFQNGSVDVTNYASANVNVSNSYSSDDEGKVVSNGALVAQGSDSVTQNGTVDTTLISSLTVNVPSSGMTMYTGTYEPSTMPTANVPFSCAGATNFLIRVADTAAINTGTGHAYFYLIYASTSKTSQFGSNNGGTAISNGTDRYSTGARSGTSPGVKFTADGVELIYYNSTSYRWVQAGLTYNWYAW